MGKVTQAHIDARMRDILDSAMRLFARQGVDGTTMQEIAQDAGLSAGAIYRYYPSKEDLLRAVFADCTERHRALFHEAAAGTESPLQAIKNVGRTAWDELKKEGYQENIILNLETALAAVRRPDELGAAHRDVVRTVVELVEGLIRQAQDAGEVEPSVDARALAVTLLACHIGCGLLGLQLEGEVDTDAVYASLMEMTDRLALVPA